MIVGEESVVTIASFDSSQNIFDFICFFRLCSKKISSPEAISSWLRIGEIKGNIAQGVEVSLELAKMRMLEGWKDGE